VRRPPPVATIGYAALAPPPPPRLPRLGCGGLGIGEWGSSLGRETTNGVGGGGVWGFWAGCFSLLRFAFWGRRLAGDDGECGGGDSDWLAWWCFIKVAAPVVQTTVGLAGR
jgi:hypothetical protein